MEKNIKQSYKDFTIGLYTGDEYYNMSLRNLLGLNPEDVNVTEQNIEEYLTENDLMVYYKEYIVVCRGDINRDRTIHIGVRVWFK
ncbi:hypothetical protein [Dickeya zeae]|uniref:hypothetical protein n=1 Tax=Dickeya zeae TaxID=204042 RepID=UPI001F3D7204|nr:hypothetical protein [Dickeya zeae]UJR61899.1 hypothetical protein HJ586_06585 [Dickeya zeae]